MSLSRMALSLSLLEALRPQSSLLTGPYPTKAEHRVFRERFGSLDSLDPQVRHPLIVIQTGRDVGMAGDGAGPPFRRVITAEIALCVMICMSEDGEDPFWDVPANDAECDDALNILEHEVRTALSGGPSGHLFRDLNQKWSEITSEQEREPEEGYKLGARRLTLVVQVPDECPPRPSTSVGLDRVPNPLRRVLDGLIAAGYDQEIAAALGDALPVAPVATPFAGLSLAIDLNHDGATDIAATVDLTQD